MAQIRTDIVIGGKAQEALKALEDVRKGLASIRDAAGQADGAAPLTRTRAGLESISRELGRMRQLFFAVQAAQGFGQAVQSVFATADAFTSLTARLKLAAGSQDAFNTAFAGVSRIADQNRAGLAETAQVYTRVSATLKNLGATQADVLNVIEAVTLSLRISGATAEESASALLQFGQGLSSNFQGDEFRALTENAPRLLAAVAEGLKVPVEQLKSLSTQGKLTSDVVSNALIGSLQKLRAEAEGLPLTVGGSFQLLRNAVLQYVGATDQARGTSSTAAQAVKLLADNFKLVADALAAIAALIAAGAIGRLVSGLVGLVSAGGASAGVLARLVALLGGPVGVVGAMAAAGAGAVVFGSRVKEGLKPAEEKLAEVREEIQKIQEALGQLPAKVQQSRLEALREERATVAAQQGVGEFDTGSGVRLRLIDEQIAKEEAALTKLKAAQAERDRLGKVQESRIREPAKAHKDANQGLSTTRTILDEFNQREKDIALSAEAERSRIQDEINRARETNDEKALADAQRRLNQNLRDQAESHAQNRRARATSLRGLSDPERIPQLKEEFDQEFTLLKDQIARERALLEDQNRDNLVSIAGYFRQKELLAELDFDNEERRLKDEETRLAAHLVELTSRRAAAVKRGEKPQIEQFDEAIAGSSRKLTETQTQLTTLTRERASFATRTANEEARVTKELEAQVAEIRESLALAQGRAGGDVARARLQRQFAGLQARLEKAGDTQAVADLKRFIDVEAAIADLKQFEAQFQQALERMANAEASINIRRQNGLLTESQARLEILRLYQATGAEVEGLIPRMEELAAAAGNPEAVNRVAQLKNRVAELKTTVDDVANAVNGAVRDSFQSLFADVARGGKSMKDIFLDFIRSIESALTKIASQQLADKLFGAPGAEGGFGGLIARFLGFSQGGGGLSRPAIDVVSAIVNHQGGIVGRDGPTRRVNPLAFLGAPRFHLGGVMGLSPDEVPIIGRRGEEVLVESDPRHRANGGGGVNVTMVVNTPDVNSFRRSEGQITADMARAISRARRNT